MVLCPSYPPSVCSVIEGGGVMQRGPIRSLGSVSKTDRQCNPRLFGDGSTVTDAVRVRVAGRRAECRVSDRQGRGRGKGFECKFATYRAVSGWAPGPRPRRTARIQ
jgi:hypothetical protein